MIASDGRKRRKECGCRERKRVKRRREADGALRDGERGRAVGEYVVQRYRSGTSERETVVEDDI